MRHKLLVVNLKWSLGLSQTQHYLCMAPAIPLGVV